MLDGGDFCRRFENTPGEGEFEKDGGRGRRGDEGRWKGRVWGGDTPNIFLGFTSYE